MDARQVVAAALVIALVGAGPFVYDVSPDDGERVEPVAFDRTESVGVPDSAVKQAQRSALEIPKAEVFYSEYRYPVGYYGVESLVASLQSDNRRSLGDPLAVYVSDFSGTNATLTPEGHLRIEEDRSVGWVPAADAYFVVGSDAGIPTRDEAAVPFSARSDAASFAERYGGEVRRWADVRTRDTGSLGRSRAAWQRTVADRHERVNRTVGERLALLDRPESVTVGGDAPTLAAAVERAPPNTTVVLPPGTYEAPSLTVEKPLTIRGAGRNATHVVGDGTGSVINVTASETAIANLSLAGVGDRRSGRNLTEDVVRANASDWTVHMRKVHGYGDAAVVFDTAARSLVADVQINTTSNGILSRDSPNVTVTDLTLYGTERWDDGFLGVAAIGDRVIVQDSEFYGGKVGVFALDVSDLVVRDVRAEGMMLGVFNLYGRDLLIADNEIEDVGFGVYVEERSEGTAVVNNTLTRSDRGAIVAGTGNYLGDNVVAGNDRGIVVQGHYTLYTHNVVAANRIGFRTIGLLPTNRLTGNDVVDNAEPATVSEFNVLQTWRGNYWSSAPGVRTTDEGHLRREYRPAGPVDGRVHRQPYVGTLAASPALQASRALERRVAGLQSAGIADPAPLAQPVRPETVERVRAEFDEAGRQPDDDPWTYDWS